MTLNGHCLKSMVSDLYAIIKSEKYDDQLRAISRDYHRFDAYDLAIDWAMARFTEESEDFYQLKDQIYIYRNADINILPSVTIVFWIDEKNRTIHTISVKRN